MQDAETNSCHTKYGRHIPMRWGLWLLEAAYFDLEPRDQERPEVRAVLDALHDVGKANGFGPARDESDAPWVCLYGALKEAAGIGFDPDTVVQRWEWRRNVRI